MADSKIETQLARIANVTDVGEIRCLSPPTRSSARTQTGYAVGRKAGGKARLASLIVLKDKAPYCLSDLVAILAEAIVSFIRRTFFKKIIKEIQTVTHGRVYFRVSYFCGFNEF